MDDVLLRRIIADKRLSRDMLAGRDAAAATALDEAHVGDLRAAVAAALPDAEAAGRIVATIDAGILAGGQVVPMLKRLLTRAGLDEAAQDRAVAALPPALLVPRRTDLPLALDPVVRVRMDGLALRDLAAAATLRPEATAVLAQRAPNIDTIDDELIETLVDQGALTDAEADGLGLQVGLYHLFGGDTLAARVVASTRFAALGGAPASMRDMIAVPQAEIARALAAAGVAADAATTSAGDLAARLAERYPGDAIQRAAAAPADDNLATQLRLITPLFAVGDDLFSAEIDAAAARLGARGGADVPTALDRVRTLMRLFPGFDFAATMRGTDPAVAAREVAARIGSIDDVIRQNPTIDLLAIDLTPGSTTRESLRTDGLSEADRDAVFTTLRARQRVFAVAQEAGVSTRLMSAGYHSAVAIAREDAGSFARRSGLDPTVAGTIHSRAKDTLAGVSLTVGSIVDLLAGGFAGLAAGNLFEDVSDSLRPIAGFDEMFGWFGACNCTHCRSILSPAAYFVDLMLFVEQSVLVQDFAGALASHALNLKVRRPDLWSLPLTCANTDTILPTLEIVNETLESYIATRLDPDIDLVDRVAVASLVYAKSLAGETRSFTAPFVLAHEQASAYLQPFDMDRATLMRAAGIGGPALVAATIGISQADYAVITTPRTDPAFLRALFAADLPLDGVSFAALDMDDMLAGTGAGRADLGAIVASDTVRAAAPSIRIQAQKKSKDSVQNDIERLIGFTADGLDIIHRFLRLQRRLGWTVAELDLLLVAHAQGAAPRIDAAALDDVALTIGLCARFSLAVDEAVALWAGVSRMAPAAGTPPLFERRFNSRPYALTEGLLPNGQIRFVHPAFRAAATPLPADSTLPRLMLALRVSEEALGDLIRLLAPALGADLLAIDDSQRGFALDAANLSLLYRHARLAVLLRRTPAQLGALMTLAGVGGAVHTAAHLTMLLGIEDRLRAEGLRLEDLLYLARSPLAEAPGKVDPVAIARTIIADVAAGGGLQFADTVFAFVPRVSEGASRRLVAANMALFDPQPQEKLRLKSTTSVDGPIVIPDDVAVPVAALRQALIPHHGATILPGLIAAKLGIDRPKLDALISLAAVDLGTPAIVEALQGGPAEPLETAVARLALLTTLFAADSLTPDRIAFVSGHRPLFALDDVAVPGMIAAERIAIYARLLTAYATASAPDPAAVDAAIAGFSPATRFSAVGAATLGAALGLAPGTAAALDALATGATDAISGLFALANLARLSARSGVDAETIAALVSDDIPALLRGAEGLVSALRRRFPDDPAFDAQLAPLDARLRGRKRDALVDFALRHGGDRFSDADSLSAYFLIDVRYEGCATTSRVVAATSSVQTYVERVLLDLEQDRRDIGDAAHVHVLPSRISRSEWSWRSNYRVWEANRKVFLWPENFIEPELRDDKTPLFKALEDRLQQQDIGEQNVLDAYADYMAGFEQLAGLRIAGAYHDTGDQEVLHIFGCTTDDPPVYYYWTVTNLLASRHDASRRVCFSARQRIDLAIAARTVSPYVSDGRLRLFWNDIATAAMNEVSDGASRFVGYRHKVTTKFASLRLDGSWSPPQTIAMAGADATVLPGQVVIDRLATWQGIGYVPSRAIEKVTHFEPRDDYQLGGFWWDRVTPITVGSSLVLNAAAYATLNVTDLFDRRQTPLPAYSIDLVKSAWRTRPLLHIADEGTQRSLYRPPAVDMSWWYPMPPSAQQALVADANGFRDFLYAYAFGPGSVSHYAGLAGIDAAHRGSPIATITARNVNAQAVFDSPGGALILQTPRDSAFVTSEGGALNFWRLGTTVSRDLSRTLFSGGIDASLDTGTQQALREDKPLLRSTADMTAGKGNDPTPIDFNGSMGAYFREIFFHIPFLIADSLNARQNFAAAQSWYHYIFDPTAPIDAGIDLASLAPDDRKRAMRDRVWRYLPFRGLKPPTLRAILTDDQAIEAYRRDPFNPHAIARLRMSAYQKSVVMKYVANLIDWGDSLFRQFTTETVNEALTLYSLAQEILGPLPADVGDCGDGPITPPTYAAIRPTIDKGSEFLMEMESRFWAAPRTGRDPATSGRRPGARARIGYTRQRDEIEWRATVADWSILRDAADAAGRSATGAPIAATEPFERIMPPPAADFRGSPAASAIARRDMAAGFSSGATPGAQGFDANWSRTRAAGWSTASGGLDRLVVNDRLNERGFDRTAGFGWSIIRQIGPVFCVPPNKSLADLRARIADRLYKIRHCRDIDGNSRDLALFAPEIDPAMLVRAKAAGLSLEDVLGDASGDLPPYRFAFLIERARSHAAAVQAFGAALLSAIEKRDAEELARLRNTQQTNMLKLGTRLREWDLKLAEDAIALIDRQRTAAEYRRDYYRDLIDTDLLPWERTQQQLRHAASAAYVIGSGLQGTAGTVHLVPQVGSPFSMKYGGKEGGDSLKAFGVSLSEFARQLEVLGASAGLEAGFERRREGWEHQARLAEHDLKQIERQATAAGIRRDIAARAVELNQQTIDDQDELNEFFATKFAGHALYNWLTTSLQRVYRQSFNGALAMARLAERAFRFERDDETSALLGSDYWTGPQAGLLAGESLMADLNDLERRFLETNYRSLEIDQSFSLMQIDPAQLLKLRETGECDFLIPELALDLFYPGQYRRRIKAARLTIPCVVGPYTNIAATLTLKRSWVRRAPKTGESELVEVPLRHSVAIATSSAQSDSGVFSFNFEDSRYMPFEGAGAVSLWTITLPRTFRPFDYQTINDAVIGLSYTASADGALRDDVEAANATIEGSIAAAITERPLTRAISLRQDHSSAFHRLLNSPPGVAVQIDIDVRILPFYLRAHALKLQRALLLVKPGKGAEAAGALFKLNGQPVTGFGQSPEFPGYRVVDVKAALTNGFIARHSLSIDSGGDFLPDPSGPSDIGTIDVERLTDIVLYVELTAEAD